MHTFFSRNIVCHDSVHLLVVQNFKFYQVKPGFFYKNKTEYGYAIHTDVGRGRIYRAQYGHVTLVMCV